MYGSDGVHSGTSFKTCLGPIKRVSREKSLSLLARALAARESVVGVIIWGGFREVLLAPAAEPAMPELQWSHQLARDPPLCYYAAGAAAPESTTANPTNPLASPPHPTASDACTTCTSSSGHLRANRKPEPLRPASAKSNDTLDTTQWQQPQNNTQTQKRKSNKNNNCRWGRDFSWKVFVAFGSSPGLKRLKRFRKSAGCEREVEKQPVCCYRFLYRVHK